MLIPADNFGEVHETEDDLWRGGAQDHEEMHAIVFPVSEENVDDAYQEEQVPAKRFCGEAGSQY